jgi:phosphate:Na+ symporter
MSLGNIISFLGGIATFLFGMNTLTSGLEKLSSGRLEALLEKLTSNIFMSVLVGALVTGLIHSSAATTVMCVGFVNAGILKLEQAVGIIMGANIGTTVTAQILRLGDISSDNVFVMLLTPEYFGPLMAVIGIIFFLFFNGGKKKTVGQFLIGLGLLFIGMKTMETAVSPLADVPEFASLFTAFSNPALGLLVGALVTALLQSSTASVGLLQAMTTTGAITFNVAVPIIMGQNIGTCITTLASSVGASRNAKRTAMLHLFFNVIGTAVFMVVIYGTHFVLDTLGRDMSYWTQVMDRGDIATFHTFFNIASTILLLPFNKLLVRLVVKVIPGETVKEEFSLLDQRFLSTPSIALDKARETVVRMGRAAQENYHTAADLLLHYDERKLAKLQEVEADLDKMEVALDNYLVHLTDRALSDTESKMISELLHSLSDYERIGDYAVNISQCATALHQRGIAFSAAAQQELLSLTSAVGQVMDYTVDCYADHDLATAVKVEPLEEVVDLICDELRDRHVERLKSGTCTVELGTQFIELLFNLERISDHCSNLATRIVRALSGKSGDIEDAHTYLKHLHAGDSEEFNQMFARYKEQYFGPIASRK